MDQQTDRRRASRRGGYHRGRGEIAFVGLNSGPTTVSFFTGFDDNAGTGEIIRYRGTTIGTNVDQNLGLNASLLQLPATSGTGSNTLSVQSSNSGGALGIDNFGILLAVTSVTIPEPATLTLLGLSAMGVLRRRR